MDIQRPARFSDGQLIQLNSEFEQHKKKQEELCVQIEELTTMLHSVAQSVEEQAHSTHDIVQLFNDLKSVTRLGGKLQDFFTSLAAMGGIAAAVAAGVVYILEKL